MTDSSVFSPTPSRSRSGRGALALLAVVGVASAPATAMANEPFPSNVRAHYTISLNGIDIGNFRFEAVSESNRYKAAGAAEVSALFGAFSWKGQTSSSGTILGMRAPQPELYAFDFRSTMRKGSVRMRFDNASVTQVTAEPNKPPGPETVPLKKTHLDGVLDPLSAILAMTTRLDAGQPCNRTLQIFDGKHRFDLSLSHVKDVQIREPRQSGQPTLGHLCRIKYRPIAGHKDNEETRDMATKSTIEVVLRPVPGAGIAVPHTVRISGQAGEVVMTTRKVDIVTAQRQKIALF